MKQIQKKIVWGLLICLGFSLSYFGSANASSYSEELKETTYRFLQYVEEGRYEAAEATLTKLRREYNVDDTEHISVFQTALNEAQSALTDPNTAATEKYHRSLTVVLLYEAMWNKVDPLWLAWKDHLLEEMKDGSGNSVSWTKSHLEDVYLLYERILPAAKVAGTDESVRILKSHMKELLTMQSITEEELLGDQLSVFAQEVNEIGVKRKKSLTEEPGFIWLMGSVGSLISFTLMYVGWRKYKGEKTDYTVKEKERDS